MKISIANLLLTILAASLLIALLLTMHRNNVERTLIQMEHQRKISELEAVLRVEIGAENLLNLSRWKEDGDISWHLENTSLMRVWHLHAEADRLNARPELIEKYGTAPAIELARRLMLNLKCTSFSDYITRYRQMESDLRFPSPNPITEKNSAEHEAMQKFIGRVLTNGSKE